MGIKDSIDKILKDGIHVTLLRIIFGGPKDQKKNEKLSEALKRILKEKGVK